MLYILYLLLPIQKQSKNNPKTKGDSKKQKNAEKCIKQAILDGANANQLDVKKHAAIHWAAEYDWPQLIHLLVKAPRYKPNVPTDVNLTQGLGGRTALHCAVLRGSANAVRALLEHGAEIEALYEEMTAIDLAIDEENEEIYEILIEAMPDLANDDAEEEEDDDNADYLEAISLLAEISREEGADRDEEDRDEDDDKGDDEGDEENEVVDDNAVLSPKKLRGGRSKLRRGKAIR